ncbi:MAG: multiprotein-bridging factor 1 family protein [Candidatus Nanohaloarchaea archaeon]
MSEDSELPDSPAEGHVFEVNGELDDTGEKVKSTEISSLDDLEEETGTTFLRGIMGEPYRELKITSGTQGTPYTFIRNAADNFSDDYSVAKTEEKIFVSPQSNMHTEFTQRKQQAEQNIRQTMSNLSELKKQKHMLEHDIRKLRSRVEALRDGDETQLKGDFVELVDGAGGGRQGGDEASLKTLRDNDIYPSIVADFNEMNSLDDLKPKSEGGTGKLADLPENVKAILKKKYTMYEKWKDLYGSEVHRKLKDLKSQLRSIERSIEETESWLEPYVRDMVMINQKNQDELANDINRHISFQGYSTQYREMEFIAHQPVRKEDGSFEEADEDEASHFKVVYIHAVHVNIAGGEQPNSPGQGPTAAVVYFFPAFMDRFVFNNVFKQKIHHQEEQFKDLMADYTGDFEASEGSTELKSARGEKGLSVRELREKVDEKIEGGVPIEFSATIRRIEDGFDRPHIIADNYGAEVLEAVDEVLDTGFAEQSEGTGEKSRAGGLEGLLKDFFGIHDIYYVPGDSDPFGDVKSDVENDGYSSLKRSTGLNTM